MPRRDRNKTSARAGTRKRYVGCLALVVVDASARRKKERTLYRRRITELERETERVKAYEEQDRPAFSRWVEAEFAPTLSAFREAVSEIAELEELENQVRACADMRRVPLWQAYKDVAAAREAGTLADLFHFDDEEPTRGGVDQEEMGDDEEMFREFEDFAKKIFGFDVEDDEPGGEDGYQRQDHGGGWDDSHLGSSRANAAERDADIYLKGLYRQLVRVLHPDSGAELTPERQRLWSEVQDAYTWGDVHRLSRLHAEVCGGDGASGRSLDLETMPIGDIISIRRPVEQRLRHLRETLRFARREPSWGFVELLRMGGHKLARLRAQLNRDLHADLADALGEKTRLERLVENWKRGPKPKAPTRRKPGPRPGAGRHGRGAPFKEGWVFD